MKKIKIVSPVGLGNKKMKPGDVVEVRENIADRLLKLKVGELVKEPKEVYVPKTQFDVPPENKEVSEIKNVVKHKRKRKW